MSRKEAAAVVLRHLAVVVGGACVAWTSFAKASVSPTSAHALEFLVPVLRDAAASLPTARFTVNGSTVSFVIVSSPSGVEQVLHEANDCNAAGDTRDVLRHEGTTGVAMCRRAAETSTFGTFGFGAAAESEPAESMLKSYLFVHREGEVTSGMKFSFSGMTLARLFPEQGDAPGGDPEGVPRPPSSRRLLSASSDAAGYSAHLYETGATLQETAGAYDHMLVASGFYQATTPSGGELSGAWLYRKDGRKLVVSFQEVEHGSQVLLAELERTAPGSRGPSKTVGAEEAR